MSSIRKELNELAIKMGAPVVGTNISEQIRALNTHLGGTSHGANISERIDEFSNVFSSGSSDSSLKKIALKDIVWEQGSLRDYTAEEKDTDDRIRTADFIEVDGSMVADLMLFAKDINGSALEVCFVLFDENKSDIKDDYWKQNGEQTRILRNTKFLRMILKRPDDGIIAPNELGDGELVEFLIGAYK